MGVAREGGRVVFLAMAANPGSFDAAIDQKLTVRMTLKAGVHEITAASLLRSHAERDDLIKPFLRTTVDGLDITGDPSVDRISVEGPFKPAGAGDTASRKKIFLCTPTAASNELPCARRIVSALMTHAYRRPIKDGDLETPLSFYQRSRNSGGGFEAGVESALQL